MNYLGFPHVPTFGCETDIKQQALKVLEEAAELVEATKAFATWCEEEGYHERRTALLDEAADVNQALANLLDGLASDEEIADSAMRCFGRNYARGRFYDEE